MTWVVRSYRFRVLEVAMHSHQPVGLANLARKQAVKLLRFVDAEGLDFAGCDYEDFERFETAVVH